MRVQVSVETLTDWSVGAGHGQPGGADRLVARDHDGLPYVPARSLRGLLRDAAEEVAAALDAEGGTGWQDATATLFGRRLTGRRAAQSDAAPAASLLHVSALRLTPELRTALLDPDRGPARLAVLTAIRPGVRIEMATGTADDRHLRFDEVVRSGLHLTGTIEVDHRLDEQSARSVLALLTLAARSTRYLGGGRRRGRGRIDCRLQPALEVEEVEALIAAGPPALELPRPSGDQPLARTEAGSTAPQERLQLHLTALEPLVLASQTRGNVLSTEVEIPGRALLPLVSEAVGGQLDVRAALRSGQLTVGPGRVRVDGHAARPIPLCLAWPKLATGEHRAASNQAVVPDATPPRDGVQYRAAKPGEYVILAQRDGATTLKVTTVDTGLVTHNVIDPVDQRPDAEAGGVYAYETVLPGTAFVAELRLGPELAAHARPLLEQQLTGERRIGAMRNAGYGRVAIEVRATEPAGSTVSTTDLLPERPFLVVADSPIVCGTEAWPLTPTAATWCATLREALLEAGADPDLVLALAPVEGRAAWLRQQSEHGWHARWGLPRPSVASVSSGSVLRLIASHPIDAAAVASVMDRGIGARTAEGYGQVRFDPPELQARSVPLIEVGASERDEQRQRALQLTASTPDGDTAGLIAELDRVAARDQILAAALEHARGGHLRAALGWDRARPSQSQLSSLRAAASVLDDVRISVTSWANHVREVEQRRAAHDRQRRWSDAQLDAVERQCTEIPEAVARALPHGLAALFAGDDALTDLVVGAALVEQIRVLGRAVTPGTSAEPTRPQQGEDR